MSPFPDAGSGLVQVSTEGGVEPMWAYSGEELFYRNSADALVAAAVQVDSSFAIEGMQVLFSVADFLSGADHPQYDVSRDDQRFLMLRITESSDAELIFVENFFEELKRRVRCEHQLVRRLVRDWPHAYQARS